MSNFNAPMILVSMVSAPGFSTTFYGNPTPPSFVPFLFLGFPQRMSFYQRTISFLTEGFIRHISQNVAYPEIERKYRQILNDSSLPSTEEFMKKTSLILSNSHFSISQHRPFLPNIVEVGGMHCRSPQPLPEVIDFNYAQKLYLILEFRVGFGKFCEFFWISWIHTIQHGFSFEIK